MLFNMQLTDKLQNKTAARTSLELSLLSDTHNTVHSTTNNALHMHPQEGRRLLCTEDIDTGFVGDEAQQFCFPLTFTCTKSTILLHS